MEKFFTEGKEKLMQLLSSESSENVVNNNSWEETLRDADLPGSCTRSSQNSLWHEISVLQLPLYDLPPIGNAREIGNLTGIIFWSVFSVLLWMKSHSLICPQTKLTTIPFKKLLFNCENL